MVIKPRITLEGRTKLETVIPLSTPYLVFLDPSDCCNFNCKICPSGDKRLLKALGRIPQLMNLDIYKKIIRDLAEMPERVKTLRLYADGEPTMNPNLHKMVSYAKDLVDSIDTTSNGSLLTPKLGKKLVDAGLDKIFISVPNNYSNDYRDQIHNFILHRKQCKVYIKIIGDGMTERGKKTFYRDFSDADRVFIENRINCWPNFNSGDDPKVGIYGNPLTDVAVCPYVMYSVKINSDGTVSLCFLDYPHQMIVGDLKTESFREVWNGEKLRNYQIMHLSKRRHIHPFCCNCHQLTHGAPDDIDKYAETLLNKIKRKEK